MDEPSSRLSTPRSLPGIDDEEAPSIPCSALESDERFVRWKNLESAILSSYKRNVFADQYAEIEKMAALSFEVFEKVANNPIPFVDREEFDFKSVKEFAKLRFPVEHMQKSVQPPKTDHFYMLSQRIATQLRVLRDGNLMQEYFVSILEASNINVLKLRDSVLDTGYDLKDIHPKMLNLLECIEGLLPKEDIYNTVGELNESIRNLKSSIVIVPERDFLSNPEVELSFEDNELRSINSYFNCMKLVTDKLTSIKKLIEQLSKEADKFKASTSEGAHETAVCIKRLQRWVEMLGEDRIRLTRKVHYWEAKQSIEKSEFEKLHRSKMIELRKNQEHQEYLVSEVARITEQLQSLAKERTELLSSALKHSEQRALSESEFKSRKKGCDDYFAASALTQGTFSKAVAGLSYATKFFDENGVAVNEFVSGLQGKLDELRHEALLEHLGYFRKAYVHLLPLIHTTVQQLEQKQVDVDQVMLKLKKLFSEPAEVVTTNSADGRATLLMEGKKHMSADVITLTDKLHFLREKRKALLEHFLPTAEELKGSGYYFQHPDEVVPPGLDALKVAMKNLARKLEEEESTVEEELLGQSLSQSALPKAFSFASESTMARSRSLGPLSPKKGKIEFEVPPEAADRRHFKKSIAFGHDSASNRELLMDRRGTRALSIGSMAQGDSGSPISSTSKLAHLTMYATSMASHSSFQTEQSVEDIPKKFAAVEALEHIRETKPRPAGGGWYLGKNLEVRLKHLHDISNRASMDEVLYREYSKAVEALTKQRLQDQEDIYVDQGTVAPRLLNALRKEIKESIDDDFEEVLASSRERNMAERALLNAGTLLEPVYLHSDDGPSVSRAPRKPSSLKQLSPRTLLPS